MSPLQFMRILVARRWIIFGSLVTCMVVALAVASVLPKRYPASARVLLDLVRPDPVTGQIVQSRSQGSYIRTQIELIKDYRIAGEVVDKLGWAQNPAIAAQFQEDTGGQGTFRRWAAQRIINSTDARMIPGSNILEIAYEAPDPETAKSVVNLLREAFIEDSLRFKTDSAGRTADWYREQADRAQRLLIAAEAAKSQFERDNGIVMTPGGTEAETSKLAGLQSALVAMQGASGAAEFRPSLSPVVDQLKMQVTILNDTIEQAAEKLGTAHPTYRGLLARRELVERQLAQETASARAANAAISGSSRQSISSLQREYELQKAKVFGMKDKLDRLTQLQRDVEQKRVQYEKAEARTAELRLESAVSESALVVLGDAIGSPSPSFPNWPQIGGLSAAFGLGLGIVLALLAELLARRIRGSEDLGFATKAPVLAVIADAPPSSWGDRLAKLLPRRKSAGSGLQPAQ